MISTPANWKATTIVCEQQKERERDGETRVKEQVIWCCGLGSTLIRSGRTHWPTEFRSALLGFLDFYRTLTKLIPQNIPDPVIFLCSFQNTQFQHEMMRQISLSSLALSRIAQSRKHRWEPIKEILTWSANRKLGKRVMQRRSWKGNGRNRRVTLPGEAHPGALQAGVLCCFGFSVQTQVWPLCRLGPGDGHYASAAQHKSRARAAAAAADSNLPVPMDSSSSRRRRRWHGHPGFCWRNCDRLPTMQSSPAVGADTISVALATSGSW